MKIDKLLTKLHSNPTILSSEDHIELNMIDSMITDIMLAGERHSSSKRIQRQHWSPKQRMIARTYSYWKQKATMETKKIFNWPHLERLRSHTIISDTEHAIIDPIFITKKKGEARIKWRSCKKKSEVIRLKFLKDKAELMALKLRTSEEKALRAIIKSEASRRTFQNIKNILGVQQSALTQVDISMEHSGLSSTHETLSKREDVES